MKAKYIMSDLKTETERNIKKIDSITLPFINQAQNIEELKLYKDSMVELKEKADSYIAFINLLENNFKLEL